ncbi:ABC transporter permease [Paenibacillus sp. sgz500958]|uniref:ABC transporter permease n=1 Tax=Paenibacillus sp. sgz500958 TaxID=3242475 RepID=UPI0036D2A9FD
MRNGVILFQKEMLEMLRSYKLAWIPVVFIILGIMQPLSTYYLPEILKASGDVPPAIMEAYEMPGAAATMVQAIGQYGTIGLLVLVLAGMNSLAGERVSGTAELVQVRPVSSLSIVLAKWTALLVLLVISLGLGAGAAGYYTEQLIGSLAWNDVLGATGLYGLWLLCILSITLLFSAFLKAPVAAFLSLAAAAGLSLVNSLVPSWTEWTPAHLSGLSAALLTEGSGGSSVSLGGPLISSLMFIVLCITGTTLLAGNNKLGN